MSDYPNNQASGEALACPYGYYSTGNGNTECTICSAGKMCPELSNTAELDCKDSSNTDSGGADTVGYFCHAGESLPRICPEGKITTSVSQTAQDVKDDDCQCLDSTKYVKTPLL